MKVEITLKLTIDIESIDRKLLDESFNERIIDDIFDQGAASSFQASDDIDYEFTYDKLEVENIK